MTSAKEMFTEQREREANHTEERQETDLIHQVKISHEFIGNAVNSVYENVRAGHLNALEVAVYLKAHQKFIDDCKAMLQKEIMDEAAKYPGKEFTYMGCEIKKQEAGTKYDYEGTGYSKYIEAKKIVKKLEALMKQAIDNEVYDESGERIPAPVKSSTSTLAITIR